jgi:hypothetical protein
MGMRCFHATMVAIPQVNADSSRSHAVLQLIVKCGNGVPGKVCLVDLAGTIGVEF